MYPSHMYRSNADAKQRANQSGLTLEPDKDMNLGNITYPCGTSG